MSASLYWSKFKTEFVEMKERGRIKMKEKLERIREKALLMFGESRKHLPDILLFGQKNASQLVVLAFLLFMVLISNNLEVDSVFQVTQIQKTQVLKQLQNDHYIFETQYRNIDENDTLIRFPQFFKQENMIQKVLTEFEYDQIKYTVFFNEKKQKLQIQILKANTYQLIQESSVQLMTSLNQCSPLRDTKFVCSTGTFLQIFDARNMSKVPMRIQACSSLRVKIHKLFASQNLRQQNIAAYTCTDEELVVRYVNFDSDQKVINKQAGFNNKQTLSIYSVDIDQHQIKCTYFDYEDRRIMLKQRIWTVLANLYDTRDLLQIALPKMQSYGSIDMPQPFNSMDKNEVLSTLDIHKTYFTLKRKGVDSIKQFQQEFKQIYSKTIHTKDFDITFSNHYNTLTILQMIEISPNMYGIQHFYWDNVVDRPAVEITGIINQRVPSFYWPCERSETESCHLTDMRIYIVDQKRRYKMLQIFDAYIINQAQ